MRMKFFVIFFSLLLAIPINAIADQAKGLNVVLTSGDRQAQMMALVLSVQTMQKHQKTVNLVLCASAGDLSLKTTKTEVFLPLKKSPTMLIHKLLGLGASIEVCPLYLPSVGKTAVDLIEGISIAKPPVVAGKLLNKAFKTLSF